MNRLLGALNFDLTGVKNELPVIVFVVVALLTGAVFIKGIGSFVGPDMYGAHYRASLAVATGQIFDKPEAVEHSKRHFIEGEQKYFQSGGLGCIDNLLVSQVLEKDVFVSDERRACIREHDKNLSDDKQVEVGATIQYPIVAYIPQASGLALGMAINMEPVDAQILARLANLVVYIILVAIAIKLVQRGKWLFVVLGLLPTSLFLASSLSADALNIAWLFLFVAYVSRLYSQRNAISTKQTILLVSLGLSIFALKIAYVPILFIILALGNRIMSTKKSWIIVLSVLLVGSAAYTIWSTGWGSMNALVDVRMNVKLLLLDFPASIVSVILNTIQSPLLLLEMREPKYFFFAGFILALIVIQNRDIQLSNPDRLFDFIRAYKLQLLAVISALATVALTYVALLVTWTDVGVFGYLNIQGFQGRYLLPLLPLLIVFYQMESTSKGRRNRLAK